MDTANQSSPLKIYTALMVAIIFWGCSFPAIKLVMTGFTPISYVFLRFAGAELLFCILMLKRFRLLPWRTHLKLAVMGLFYPTLYFILESIGMQYTSASSASILVAAAPGIAALFARCILKEKLNLRQWSGVVLSIIGVVVLAGFDDNHAYSESSMLGNSLILLAVLSATVYMIIARHLSAQLSALEITFYQVLYSLLYLLPVFLVHSQNVSWAGVNPVSIAALLFLIIGATLIAFLSYNYAISCAPVSTAAVFLNGVPLVSVILSAFILNEEIGVLQVIGGTIIVSGVTLTTWRRRSRAVPDGQRTDLG